MSVTIGITSFERSAALQRLITSINPTTRGRPIIIADNSRAAPILAPLPASANVTLIKLPFDAGLSACRNAIIRAANTKYVLICEDDFIFCKQTRIDLLCHTMRELAPHGVNVVSGAVDNGNGAPPSGWLHGMHREDSTLVLTPGPTGTVGNGHPTADLTINFFLIRRDAALAHPWREEFKQGEHLGWFWEGKQSGRLRVAHRADVVIMHKHIGNAFYNQHRARLMDYRAQWLLAAGFDRIERRVK